MNTLHNTTIAEIQNFQKNPTQKRFLEIMILRENFVGQVDAILREFPDSDNPFLEKFLSKNPDEKKRERCHHRRCQNTLKKSANYF